MKRIILTALVGLVVFGAVYGFAASLTVNSKTLGAGSATVSSCNATAAVSYNTAYASALPGYKVSTTPVASAVACANMAYKVTLSSTGSTSLAELTGTLDATGAASPDFSTSNINAANVTGVSVVITG